MPGQLRVLFAIGSLAGGGAERQTLLYLRHLDRQRFAPQLYLTYRQGELLDQVPSDVSVSAFWDRHRFPRWNVPGRIHRWQARDLARVLAERDIDVLVSVTFLATLVACSAVPQRPTPWLAVEMADPRRDLATEVKRFRWLKRWHLTRAYRLADRAVAVSEGVREGLMAMYRPPADRLAVLPNFIDVDDVDRRAAEPAPDLDPDRFHLVTVGRLNPQKGHLDLLRAMTQLVHRRRLDRLHLHLLGQGPLEAKLRDFVVRHQLQNHVTFAGYVSNPLPYVKRCQLFCLPSLYEGLPLALLEAMACTVPVLATDCPSGPREVLADGRFGRLVPAADPEALADAIADAIAQPDTVRQIARSARQRVVECYSATAVIGRLEKLLIGCSDLQRRGN